MAIRKPINRQKILDFLLDNPNQTFSPLVLSSILNIPNSSARNELRNLLSNNQVEKYNNPTGVGHLDYFTNDAIITKEWRKTQCKVYDKTYRDKKRDEKNQ